jgi:UDP-glucose 4-epimerase
MKDNKLDGRRILVTGGAGFIGSELTRHLTLAGAFVVVVDDLSNGKAENLDGVAQDHFDLVVSDIRDRARMAELARDVDTVFHLAALGVRHSIHSPEENHEVNATGTLGLLIEARRAGVKRFVCVSTSEVYGTGTRIPMDEEHPTYPMTVYGAAKLAGECYARAFYRTYGYPVVIIRPFNAFGPRSHHEGDSGEVIPKMMLRSLAGKPLIIFGNGEQTRDFTYVSDTARGIILAGLSDQAVGETINIGSGKEITINVLADKIRTILGKPETRIIHDDPRPGDTLRLYADISKAKALCGFQPETSLDDALEELKDWYLSQGVSPQELLQHERERNWETPGQNHG